MAGRAAGGDRAAGRGQAARRPAHERADPGRGLPLLRAPAARTARHARGARVRPAARAAAAGARPAHAGGRELDPAPGRLLAAADAVARGQRRRAAAEGARARRGVPAGGGVLGGRRRREPAAAVVLVGAGGAHRRRHPAPGRRGTRSVAAALPPRRRAGRGAPGMTDESKRVDSPTVGRRSLEGAPTGHIKETSMSELNGLRIADRKHIGLAEMLKGGLIMDVTNAEQATLTEDAGQSNVMATHLVTTHISITVCAA